jgi:hypothetical protein
MGIWDNVLNSYGPYAYTHLVIGTDTGYPYPRKKLFVDTVGANLGSTYH